MALGKGLLCGHLERPGVLCGNHIYIVLSQNMKHILYIILVIVACMAGCRKETQMLEDTTHPKLAVGQQWYYKTRPQESNSTLTILKIEKDRKLDVIVHIAVSEVVISSADDDESKETISHMPIDADILESSVTTIAQESVPLPDFSEGYQMWRESFNKGEAGVFFKSVSECVGLMEETLNKGTPLEE